MTATTVCPKCGGALAADAHAGLCPKCLVQAGLESENPPQPQFEATAASPPASGFEPPSVERLAAQFPQLEIIELLGKGGMGAVYKARQPGLDRLVAVKILPPEVGRDPSFAERFTREARALARLSHPNIVAVHDFGQTDGLFYIVMEHIDGANLRQTIQAGRLKPEEALAIVPQICDALQFAHDEGVVHRDIKPENILLDKRGRVKIADFGLAKLMRQERADVSLTGTQQVMGTVRYMAPEQMQGTKAVDHRADIYSLGVVFYELLTGDVPMGRFDPPSRKVQLDVRLDEVVLKALESEPDRRYQQASDVKTSVQSVVSSGKFQPEKDAPLADKSAQPHSFTPGVSSRLLAIALSIVFGALTVAGGAAMIVIGFALPDSGTRWALVGSGGGVLIGGLGTIFGTWNNYRQMKGAANLMQAPHWTALDTMFALVTVIGLCMLAAAVVFWESFGPRLTLLLLGGIIAWQGVTFSLWRWAQRRAFRRRGEGVSLDPRLLLIAGGMLLGALTMTAGLAIGIVALVYQPGGPQAMGGWLGTFFGCFFGGAGCLFGSWNSYRKMEGAEDVWASGEVTWFEWAIAAWAVLGLAGLGLGIFGPASWHESLRWGLGVIGGILLFQALIFGVLRGLTIRAGRQERAAAAASDSGKQEPQRGS